MTDTSTLSGKTFTMIVEVLNPLVYYHLACWECRLFRTCCHLLILSYSHAAYCWPMHAFLSVIVTNQTSVNETGMNSGTLVNATVEHHGCVSCSLGTTRGGGGSGKLAYIRFWSPRNFGGIILIGWWLRTYISAHEGTCSWNNNMANLIDRPAIDARIEATIVQ